MVLQERAGACPLTAMPRLGDLEVLGDEVNPRSPTRRRRSLSHARFYPSRAHTAPWAARLPLNEQFSNLSHPGMALETCPLNRMQQCPAVLLSSCGGHLHRHQLGPAPRGK